MSLRSFCRALPGEMIKDVLTMFNALVKLVVLMKANSIPLLYPTIYLLRKWLGPSSIPVHKKIKGQFSCNTVFKTSWSLFIKKHYFEIQSISWTVLIYNLCLKKVLNFHNTTVARFFYLLVLACLYLPEIIKQSKCMYTPLSIVQSSVLVIWDLSISTHYLQIL